MDVTQASYGSWVNGCLTNTLSIMGALCNGKNACEIFNAETVWDQLFGNPCLDRDQLNVTYHCLANYISSDADTGKYQKIIYISYVNHLKLVKIPDLI